MKSDLGKAVVPTVVLEKILVLTEMLVVVVMAEMMVLWILVVLVLMMVAVVMVTVMVEMLVMMAVLHLQGFVLQQSQQLLVEQLGLGAQELGHLTGREKGEP